MKILLLDDDSFSLSLLAHQLARAGHEDVTLFSRAELALAAVSAAAGAIDLVFCDLQMPGIDGVEFVRHLVAAGYAGGLVLVSGEERRIVQTVEKLAAAHRLRILGALSKPVAIEALKLVLERASALPTTTKASRSQLCSAEELAGALERRELVNHYQPKVDVASGAIVGIEALVRWQHPRLGLIYPDRFVLTAEQHGLIGDLTATVLHAALREVRRWSDGGIDLHVAVNVSMDNLGSLNFPDFVAGAVSAAGVPPTSLVLEITESRLMADPLASLDILTRLRLKHIGLAIDDFGTGHSSLAQLRDIPFDELKVDRGFIHGAHADGSLRAIVDGSVAMARQMGIRTVAEGIEDIADWRFVHEAGFDLAQGYFLGKPVPAEQIPASLADWRSRCARIRRSSG